MLPAIQLGHNRSTQRRGAFSQALALALHLLHLFHAPPVVRSTNPSASAVQRSINICIQQSPREHAADTAVGSLHAQRLPRRRAAHVAHLRPAAAALRRAVSVRLVNTALYSGFAQLRVLQIRRKPLFCYAQVRFGNVLENLRAAKGWSVPVFVKHRALTSSTSVY